MVEKYSTSKTSERMYRMYEKMDRVYNERDGVSIPGVAVSEQVDREVPRQDGQPGFYVNTFINVLFLNPDTGVTYLREDQPTFFLSPRMGDEAIDPRIDALPDDPDTIVSKEPNVDPYTAAHLRAARKAAALAQVNGGGTQARKVTNAATEATAE